MITTVVIVGHRQHYETIYGGRDISSSNPVLYRPEYDELVKLLILFLLGSFKSTSGVVLMVGHRTCNSQVAGSSPVWVPPRIGLGLATYTGVPLSPSSIIWYWPRDSDAV